MSDSINHLDEYSRYEKGLEALFERLDEHHPAWNEAHRFRQRLLKNIANTRLYGESDLSRSELLKVVSRLNRLARNELDVSFYELSGCPITMIPPDDVSSDAECRLRDQIGDAALRSSINSIRHTVEYIWDQTKSRIIQDGTDHGPEYSKRLLEFVDRLLAANDGRALSSQELYLLLAGIYLHDVGMQCDVVAMPEVRARAEQMGAHFDVDMTQIGAEGYSIAQQKAIRKNHAYLSAAWIAYARQTGDTPLGPAAMSIPRELLDDLVDICAYHSGYPLTTCPLTLRFDPSGRKQLLVALIRFADELDIEINRVPIEIIASHAVNTRNIIYWWLHNRTRVLFIARNVIRLAIFLHPDDVAVYGDFAHNAFINEFQSRNAPALSILAKNGIPIVIDAESRVEGYAREDPFPPEVVQAFQAAIESEPLYELTEEVRTWLRAMRYEVTEPRQIDDHMFEMIATVNLGAMRQRICVRCVGGNLRITDVDALDKIINRKTPQGWIISEKAIPDAVLSRIEAQKDGAIEALSMAEFLQRKVWEPYFDALTALIEKDSIARYYVDMKGSFLSGSEAGHEAGDESANDAIPSRQLVSSVDDYVDLWLSERDRPQLAILGECGTGKSWFCRHYADRQLKRYLKNPLQERFPLLISLRDVARASSMQQLISGALVDLYKLPFVGGGYQVFDEINRRGKLLLILDGFDELARQVDAQTNRELFTELTELIEDASKVILTSRVEYLCWSDEQGGGGGDTPLESGDTFPSSFEQLVLEPLDDGQIRRLVTLRLGAKQGPAVAEHILQTPSLSRAARKPMRVDLLLNAMNEVDEKALRKFAHVYLYATNHLLLRNIDTRGMFTSATDKIFFLSELAWEMIRNNEMRIHYSQIPHRITAFFGQRIKEQHERDTWDIDLRQQKLLLRNASGFYEFSHNVIAEYFVAYKFGAELGSLDRIFAKTYCDNPACEQCIPQRSCLELAETFGLMSLAHHHMKPVRMLLLDMLAEDAAQRLWALVQNTRGKTPQQVRYVGGNALTLLKLLGEDLAGTNLENTVLIGADLRGSDLSGTNLRQAYLSETMLQQATLDEADLRESTFSLPPSLLAGATFRGARIDDARGLDFLQA